MANSINDKAFQAMITSAEADKSKVTNLFGEKKSVSKDDIHNALMVAGFTPGLGNIADATDAALYAFEGEYGKAALSAAAMIPFVGQTISGKKALKAAEKAGEKIITLYRGVPQWFPGQMVKDGMWVGGKKFINQRTKKDNPLGSWGSVTPQFQDEHVKSMEKAGLWVSGSKKYTVDFVKKFPESRILEFQVPESYITKNFTKTGTYNKKDLGFFLDGLPVGFMKKVHKVGK